MSANASALLDKLRELLSETDLTLPKISDRTHIQYMKLWRFKNQGGALSLDDAETLYIDLTGKTFIASTDA